MNAAPIDVWDLATFDPELTGRLTPHAGLVADYFARDHAIFLGHDLGRGPGRSLLRPDNPYADRFQAFREGLIEVLKARTIRAWHYTRLTDAEVDALRREGPHVSTPVTLKRRLGTLVEARALSAAQAAALYAASPFHTDQRDARSDKFWMVSHPLAIDDGGVEPLMAHWGGEGASMFQRDPDLLGPLARIGRPRIVELAIPLSATRHAYCAVEAVVATFGRAEGAIPSKQAFDLYIGAALPGDAVREIHTEGEATFAAMGRTHPRGFVDVDLGRWKELAGEED